MPPSEIEAKLDVPTPEDLDRVPGMIAELGYFVGDGESYFAVDHYLDTPDLDVFRSGWALRLRDKGTRQLLTLKACVAVGADGLAVRDELEVEVAWEPRGGWVFDPKVLDGRLAEFTQGKELAELFEIRQQRRVHDLSDGAELWVELSCDRIQWIRGDSQTKASAVELELKKGSAAELRTLFEKLQERTSWPPAAWSKFEVGVSGSDLA